MYNLKQLGNFPQFWKDEIYIVFKVLIVAYIGTSTLSILNLKDNPTILNNILPDDTNRLPYKNTGVDVSNMSLFTYLFSFESNFPYAINTGISYFNPHFLYLGGICSYLFSANRYGIKKAIELFPYNKNTPGFMMNCIDIIAFYILPYIIVYLIIPMIVPFITFCLSILSLISQNTAKSWNGGSTIVWPFLFLFLSNFVHPDLFKDQITLRSIPFYIANIWWGFIFSFGAIPFTVFWSIVSICVYVFLFYAIFPVFVWNGGKSWEKIWEEYRTIFSNHGTSLLILFLYYSIGVANKNLNLNIAFGVKLAIAVIILMLLNVFSIIKDKFVPNS
jgi:hypothetical protein